MMTLPLNKRAMLANVAKMPAAQRREWMEELRALGIPGKTLLDFMLEYAAGVLRASGDYVVVRRCERDRGAIVVDGEHDDDRILAPSECPVCGRVGHVAYLAPSFESWSFETPARKRKPRWLMHETHSSGDSLFECVWCGAAFTNRDLMGTERFMEELSEWLIQEREAKRVVVVEGMTKLGKAPRRRGGRGRRGER